MRLFFAIILTAITAASAANASSFAVLKGLDTPVSTSMIAPGNAGSSTSSVVALDSRKADAGDVVQPPSLKTLSGLDTAPLDFIVISNSVIAMVDIPPVTFENVASISKAKDPRTGRVALPMVIRGGIAGDAFISHSATSGGDAAPTPPQQQASAPSGAGGDAPSKPEPKERGEPSQLPKQALPKAAAPTSQVE